MSKNLDVLCIGACYLDINAYHFPLGKEGLQAGSYTVGNEYTILAGGSSINVARVSKALNLKAAVVGKIGQDNPGKKIQNLLKKEGVASGLIQSHNAQTNLGINISTQDNKQLTLVLGNANQSLSASEVLTQIEVFLPRTKYLCLSGIFKLKALFATLSKVIKRAHAYRVKIVLDHGFVTNQTSQKEIHQLKELIYSLKHGDLYVPNQEEFIQVWGGLEVTSSLKTLSQRSPMTIAVTLDKDGAIGAEQGSIIKKSSINTQVIASVGAGDAFNAGMIAAQLEKKSLKDSLAFANATAALKISQTTLPERDQIAQLIKNHQIV